METEKKSLVETDYEFKRYYIRHLQPLERHFESLRRKAIKERNRRIVASLTVWLFSMAGTGYMAQPIGEFWPFVAFFALASGVGLGMWAWLPAGAHELRLQDKVLTRIVPFFGDLRYQSEPHLAPEAYQDWMVLPSFSKAYSEDQIEGSYRGVPLKLAEVRLQYQSRSSSSNSSSTRIAFKGLMIEFQLGQRCPGVTLIRSRGSDMRGRFRLNDALAKADDAFGFEVFATSDAPGATLADAAFLERLATVSDQFAARQLFASFHADRLVVLIEHKGNYFEMSHRQQTDFAKDADRVRDQLQRLLAIVDRLQLRGPPDNIPVEDRDAAKPKFPALTAPGAPDPYDVGGWGCLGAFVLFAAGISAYLWVLDAQLPRGAVLGWSTLGGFLLALGIFQLMRGIGRRSIGAIVVAILLLSGAFAVLYYHLPPDTQKRIQSYMP